MRDGEVRDVLPPQPEIRHSRCDTTAAIHEQADSARLDEMSALHAPT
jgi:hypothetical protein